MERITLVQAIYCIWKLHEKGETWRYSISMAFKIRYAFNGLIDRGYTKDDLMELIDRARRDVDAERAEKNDGDNEGIA